MRRSAIYVQICVVLWVGRSCPLEPVSGLPNGFMFYAHVHHSFETEIAHITASLVTI